MSTMITITPIRILIMLFTFLPPLVSLTHQRFGLV